MSRVVCGAFQYMSESCLSISVNWACSGSPQRTGLEADFLTAFSPPSNASLSGSGAEGVDLLSLPGNLLARRSAEEPAMNSRRVKRLLIFIESLSYGILGANGKNGDKG